MLNFLIILAAYLPFQVALNPSQGIDLASIRVLIIFIFLAWLAKSLKDGKITVSDNLQTGFILSFLFISSLSILAAQNTDWAFRKILFLLSIFPIYFVASAVLDDREKIIKTANTAVLSGTAAAFLGIVQFVSQFFFGLEKVYAFWSRYVVVPFLGKTFSQAVLQNPSWLVNVGGRDYLRATAVFPDPHMFSFFLGMLVPVALALFIGEKRKALYGLSFAVLFACDLATFSRGGYLGLFFGVVFAIIYYWKKIKKEHKIVLAGIGAVMLLVIAAPNPVSSRYLSIFDLKEGSNKGRIEIWKQAAGVIREKPVIGAGIGNYPLEIKATADYREPIYAHNAYLDIAAETGIPNALVWVGVLFFSIVSFLKISKRDPLFAAFAGSVAIFSIHSLAETAIYSPAVLSLFLLILSFSNYKPREQMA